MTVQCFRVKHVVVTLLVLLATSVTCVAQHAAVSGVVRDGAGVTQLGVLVQVTAADASVVGRAFTDLRGHYLVSNLMPGRYEVHATAALFAPALKPNLQLAAGARAVVNLTLSTIFDTVTWLPAERRKADEPADDWSWTLRSATNRPILRMVEDGELVMVSSSAVESHTPTTRGRATMTSGDGGFGGGGIHSIVTVDKAQEDGAGVVLRADTGGGSTQIGVGPSTELNAGFEQQTGFATATRAVASFQSHPEFVSMGSVAGLQMMEIATVQRTKLGDLVNVEAGGTMYAVHTAGYAFVAQPFLRVMIEPAAGWTMGYKMATSRDLQSFSGLNAIQPEVPVAVQSGARLKTPRGRHQEVVAGRKVGQGQVQVALYRDVLERVALAGGGTLSTADLDSLGTNAVGFATGGIVDSSTNSFRLLTSGYQTRGVNVMMSQPLGAGMWAAVEYSTGSGLAGDGTTTATLPGTLNTLHKRTGQSAVFAVKGSLANTGTKVRAVYRWQPHDLVTPVDSYREFSDQAYLSMHVRQPLRWEGVLPPGLEASVDVTNLLAQGYLPFLSADERTLYLAQAPKTLQAGLSISF